MTVSLVVMSISLVVARQADPRINSDAYTATRQGTVLVYNSAGSHPGNQVFERVTEVKELSDGKLVRINMTNFEPDLVLLVSIIHVTKRGLYATENMRGKVDPPALVFRNGDKPGGTWETLCTSKGNKYLNKYTVIGTEIVEVPAGKFETVRVDVSSSKDGGPPRKSTKWYARGVGAVKIVDEGNRITTVLIAVKPPK